MTLRLFFLSNCKTKEQKNGSNSRVSRIVLSQLRKGWQMSRMGKEVYQQSVFLQKALCEKERKMV